MKQLSNIRSNRTDSVTRPALFDRDMRYLIGPVEHRDHDAISNTVTAARSWARATIIAPVAALGVIAIAVAASLDITASGVDQRTANRMSSAPSAVLAAHDNRAAKPTAAPLQQSTPANTASEPTAAIRPVEITPASATAVSTSPASDGALRERDVTAVEIAATPADNDNFNELATPAFEETNSDSVEAASSDSRTLVVAMAPPQASVPAVGGPGLHPAEETVPASVADRADVALDEQTDMQSEDSPWRSVKIKRGDTLGAIFERFGFKISDAIEIVKDSYASPLKNLMPGKEIQLMASPYGGFDRLRYALGVGKRIEVEAGDEAFKIRRIEQEPEIRQREVSGVVENSLFESASEIGLHQNVIMQMADIFAYQIDFALDIRQGDRYSIIFEEKFIDDVKIGDGEIIAAEFVNDGNSHRAIRHKDEESQSQYYTPEGESLRRAFLRTPVKFSRISSKFSRKRYHPILKKWRAHKGVDYAARRGTPVLATADGKVSFAGRKGGYGKMIELKHGRKYRTRYAHLHKFKAGVRSGAKVKQGDVIGYVGRTGWATGPHLHYEFHVNGQHRNPLTVKLPRSMSIDKRYRNQFIDNALILGGRLDALNANVASYDSGTLRRNNS